MDEPEAIDKAVATLKPRSRFAFLLRPAVLIPLTLFALLVAVPLGYRSSRLAGIPPIDDIVDQEREGRIDIKPAENAFTYYKRALASLFSGVGPAALGDAIDALPAGGWEAAAPVAEQALDDSEEILAEWKRGTECERGIRIQPADMEYSDLPQVQGPRTMAELAILASARSLHEGNVNESWEWLRSLLRYSRHVGAFGTLTDRTIGHSTHAFAAQGVARWVRHPDVTVSLLKDAQADLRQIRQMLPPLSVSLKTEYLTVMKLLDSPETVREFFRNHPLPPFKRDGLRLEGYLFLNAEPELARVLVRHAFANQLSQCDLPRWERTVAGIRFFRLAGAERPPLMDPTELESAVMRSQLAPFGIPNISYVEREDRALARQTALELCLCVESFRRTHSRYPESLNALVPEFLDEVPRDLFGAAATDRLLIVHRDVELWTSLSDGTHETVVRPGIVIYSRGPDGKDDSGRYGQDDDDVGVTILIEQPEAKPE
jgi:hypothetical protein